MRRWWVFGLILFATGSVGCTTDIAPPSGPAETEICFNPTPATLYRIQYDGEGVEEVIDCGWWVDFRSADEVVSIYSLESCVRIPQEFLPGDDLSITVTGDTGYGFFKCQWIDFFKGFPGVPGWKLTGHFKVTD
jgi:hypothetical protein